MSTIASTFASLLVAIIPVVPHQVPMNSWQPMQGDRVIVDTLNNEGFLIHSDGRYVRFDVVTGQRRRVFYIGRSYYASTPNWEWQIKDLDIKGDRVTFGPTGRFLRLFKDGDDRTAYGFHEHRDEEELFSDYAAERFRSMGCIILRSDMMDLMVATWELNGNVLNVTTLHGIEDIQQVVRDAQGTEIAMEIPN